MGVFDTQACVPTDWTDEQIINFAEKQCPCGTKNGWCIRKEGDKNLAGDPERVPCGTFDGYVHVMLDA